MSQGVHLRKYGVAATIDFELYEIDGVDFRVDAAHASGDTKIMKDEGAEANTTNSFTDEGQGYSIVLTATEMQAARIVLYIVDSATKAWLDKSIVIETYGNASAMHAMDFDDPVRAGLTSLPNAVADAAGGLPISDAGGLDLDGVLSGNTPQTGDSFPTITALNNISTSDVLAQVNAAIDTAISELGVAAPAVTPTLRTGMMLMYMSLRNKTVVQTSGVDALEIYNNAGTIIAKKLLTDDGSDLTEAEMTSG